MATDDPTPQTKCGPSGLLKLPPELVEKIAFHLSPTTNGVVNPWEGVSEKYTVEFVTRDDFLTLRHTCRQMNDMTFSSFRRQYFTERVVKLQTKSLQQLSQIAAHPALGRQVRNLRISPQFHDWAERIVFEYLERRYHNIVTKEKFEERDEAWSKTSNSFQRLRSSIFESVDEDQQLWTSGLITVSLTRIMGSLQGLQSVSYGNHNISNPKLGRFHRQTARLWETAKIEEIEGTSLEDFHQDLAFDQWYHHRHKGFNMVKAALIDCGKSLSSLRFEHGSFLLRDMTRESKSEALSSLLEQCFEGLRALHVSFSPIVPGYVSDTEADEDLEDIVYDRPTDEPGSGDALLFLEAAPRTIEELGLSLHIDPEEINASAEDRVFAATPVFDDLFRTIDFPGLRKLSIKNTFHAVKSMAQLISNHKTSLRVVHISPSVPDYCDPEWASYLDQSVLESGFTFGSARWSIVLEALLQCENLVDLRMRTQSYNHTSGGNTPANHGAHKWNDCLWYAWEESYNAAPWVIKPRAKFLKNRLEQHLEDWEGKERMRNV